jgi:hypothetical protein
MRSRRLVLPAAGRVGERVAQLRVGLDELAEREQLVLEPLGVGSRGPHHRDDPETLERVGQVASLRPALRGAGGDHVEGLSRDLAREHAAQQGCLGLALDRHVGRHAPQRGLVTQQSSDGEQVLAHRPAGARAREGTGRGGVGVG